MPGHRDADVRGSGACRRESNLDEGAGPERVREATKRGKLRPNSVDSITGENSGDNLGPGTPIVHFDQWPKDEIEVKLILKGRLREHKRAVRAADRACASWPRRSKPRWGAEVHLARRLARARQGMRARRRGRVHRGRQDVGISSRERTVVSNARRCESGFEAGGARRLNHGDGQQPRGRHHGIRRGRLAYWMQGRCALNRLPASFSFRLRMTAGRSGGSACGSIRAPARYASGCIVSRRAPSAPMLTGGQEGFPRTGREIPIAAPISDEQIRALRVGDVVLVSGLMYRAATRLRAPYQARAARRSARRCALSLRTCRREEGRVDRHRCRTDDEHPRRAVPGRHHPPLWCPCRDRKGGMGAKTLQALKENGAVYLNAVGGAARFMRCIERVDGVSLMEFGTP